MDSLYILQDDIDDWLREAAIMNSVYWRLSLNIAASGAPDGSVSYILKPKYALQYQIQVKSDNRAINYHCIPSITYNQFLSDIPRWNEDGLFRSGFRPLELCTSLPRKYVLGMPSEIACETFPEQIPLQLTYTGCYFQKQSVSRSMWGCSWILQHQWVDIHCKWIGCHIRSRPEHPNTDEGPISGGHVAEGSRVPIILV